MKRNTQSNRSIKWLKRNSLQNPDCVRYIKSLCSFYRVNLRIENNFIIINDNELYIDEDSVCVISKKNGIFKKYYNDSCWVNAIKDIIDI